MDLLLRICALLVPLEAFVLADEIPDIKQPNLLLQPTLRGALIAVIKVLRLEVPHVHYSDYTL